MSKGLNQNSIQHVTRYVPRDILFHVSIKSSARRAREGRDTRHSPRGLGYLVFQSTRPHGARLNSGKPLSRHSGFNPRARTGRDEFDRALKTINSTFQSTRPHGARLNSGKPLSRHSGFNPRARTGRDLCGDVRQMWITCVSIHAPARGATGDGTGRLICSWCFNPRARTGRDWLAWPRRSRLQRFNPRARTGRDNTRLPFISDLFVSIHAPARGATDEDQESAHISAVSIHAPARGATECGQVRIPAEEFQSTRPHGARL